MKYEMRVVRRTPPDLRFIVFARDDRTILERMAVWACAQAGRDEWTELVLEREDPAPPGFMRLVIRGPFDAPVPPGSIADFRIG